MLTLTAMGPSGEYRTRRTELITDVAGVPVAELSIVPPLYVARTVNAQRKVRPIGPSRREAALADAAEVFGSAVIAGMDFERYVQVASRVSGLPIAVTRADARDVAAAVRSVSESVRPARPRGTALDWREVNHDGAVWARRGEVFAVHASGNAPGINGLWPQALALGYRVAIRPSRREPFTGQRLVAALRQSGFRPEDVTYLPTHYAGADELIRAADRTLAYGGQDVADRYADDPTVWVNGPGRAKILLTAEQDWREHLDIVVDSICRHGGTACVNATAVLYEGDAAPLAAAIAERLSRLPALPLRDEAAVLPVHPVESAGRLADFVAKKAAGTTPLLRAEQVVADLGDGTAALRPAVHLLAAPDPDVLNTELPFPCVWVSRWSRTDGVAPLRRSLVLTAISTDEDLIDALVDDPTIANVYRGPCPTWHTANHIPHDGFLADFLMCNKGFARA